MSKKKENFSMSTPLNPRNKEQPSTYIVQDRNNKEELTRLTLQDQLLTTSMGGVFSEFPDPSIFLRVLDIGCGTGGWIIEAARKYPKMSLVGVDISQRMVSYAQEQAEAQGVQDRVEFRVMDLLRMLEFANNSFDLINIRLGGSFLRTWDWPKALGEMLRLTKLKGIIRVTDQEIMHQSNSPATTRLNEMVLCAFYRAGHLFTQETTGLTAHLPSLLVQHGYAEIQTKAYQLEYRAGTPEGEKYSKDMAQASQTLRPFIQKWGCISEDYDKIYQQSLKERQDPDFHAVWKFLCVWGTKS
jgi:ubiquinone/menaquinone biosynthesis C-methylase UbiE